MTHRCPWAQGSELEQNYHDLEWGVPQYDDQILFEFLILESMQAGLSWRTILVKRENYRQAFDQFDAHKIASYEQAKVDELMLNPGIIRNRLKIQAASHNARLFLEIQDKFDSFSNYFWQFTDGKPIVNAWKDPQEVPATTPLSDQMSKDMKKRGFKFFGSTIFYAHMQAMGMVNDHLVDCFRYGELGGHALAERKTSL